MERIANLVAELKKQGGILSIYNDLCGVKVNVTPDYLIETLKGPYKVDNYKVDSYKVQCSSYAHFDVILEGYGFILTTCTKEALKAKILQSLLELKQRIKAKKRYKIVKSIK